ncbi:hypothetical protein P9B49_19070, partial [Bacillus safensis]|uniref:hypothetical protein n=1 Tax=Bacillus safensis TaxID=561879 RepID=UPI002DB925F9
SDGWRNEAAILICSSKFMISDSYLIHFLVTHSFPFPLFLLPNQQQLILVHFLPISPFSLSLKQALSK